LLSFFCRFRPSCLWSSTMGPRFAVHGMLRPDLGPILEQWGYFVLQPTLSASGHRRMSASSGDRLFP
jgi:hypothetical protein